MWTVKALSFAVRALLCVTILLVVLAEPSKIGDSISFVKNAPRAPGDVVPVVVAAVDLPRGVILTREVLKVREFPKDLVPVGALSKSEDAVDRAVASPLYKDDPLIERKLTPEGAGRDMAAQVPIEMRAYTIQTPNVAPGGAGFILPGNKVDVLLAVGDNVRIGANQIDGGTTTMLLQNVEILTVDRKVYAPAENKIGDKDLRSVTLLVSPQQANLLTLGQKKGHLHLARHDPMGPRAGSLMHELRPVADPIHRR
jgi:pilus assembly protein CpaB